MLIYPAVFTQDGNYIMVEFPDVPEALTQGETLEEAFNMAVEVLGFALEDKKELPNPSSLENIQAQYPDGQIALVSINLADYRRKYHSKKIRKNVTIPEWVNELAVSENINFSQTLTDALKEKLEV